MSSAHWPGLDSLLTQPARRAEVVTDALGVLDAEVHGVSGLSGIAVRTALAAVQKLRPGILSDVLDGLLPDFARALDPLVQTCPATTSLTAFLTQRDGDVASRLLAITDARATRASDPLRKAYGALRGQAEKHVRAGVPRLAAMMERQLRRQLDLQNTAGVSAPMA